MRPLKQHDTLLVLKIEEAAPSPAWNAALEAGRGMDTDSPFEPLEGNMALLTP